MSNETMPGVLVVVSGELEGQRFELGADETLIGRNPGSHVTLPDGGVSREHAVILFDAEAALVTIEDLQSTNGTKVNGKAVRSAPLTDGDTIQLGRTELLFRGHA